MNGVNFDKLFSQTRIKQETMLLDVYFMRETHSPSLTLQTFCFIRGTLPKCQSGKYSIQLGLN